MGNSCASGPSQGRRRLRPPAVPSLRGVLPAFQLKENVSSPPWLADPRAQAAATLACAIVPFRFEDLVCVSCQGLCYESDSIAEARERTQRDGFLDEDFRGRAPDAARKVGQCVLHPLQGAVVARLVRMAERPERTIADLRCSPAPHVVRRRAPRRKTFVASALALARELTY